MESPDNTPDRGLSAPRAEAADVEDPRDAADQAPRATNTLGAREFVSERDALEDAWAGSGEHRVREEGW